MEILQIIREYFETLKWVLLALLIILFFKNPIYKLIGNRRLKRINPKTGDIELEQAEKQDKPLIITGEFDKLKEKQNKLLEVLYESKTSEREYKLQYDLIEGKEEDIEILKKELGKIKRELFFKNELINFEKFYNFIFRSQIEMLKFLKTNPIGLNQTVVNSFFINTGLSKKFAWWDLNKYLSFLFTNNLITYSNNSYKITARGLAFLQYLKLSGYAGYEKPL